jgi:hypothetical protein
MADRRRNMGFTDEQRIRYIGEKREQARREVDRLEKELEGFYAALDAAKYELAVWTELN